MHTLTKPMRDTLVRLLDGAQTASLPSNVITSLRTRGLMYQDSRNLTAQGRSAAQQIRESRMRAH